MIEEADEHYVQEFFPRKTDMELKNKKIMEHLIDKIRRDRPSRQGVVRVNVHASSTIKKKWQQKEYYTVNRYSVHTPGTVVSVEPHSKQYSSALPFVPIVTSALVIILEKINGLKKNEYNFNHNYINYYIDNI